MDTRSARVLETLVRLYIDTGEPVGSRVLARCSGLAVSPATVRNIVADLEEQGLVRSPHTSAGRVPTARGYRWFVELLGDLRHLGDVERERIRTGLVQQASDLYHLGQGATRLLSGWTHYVGIVLVPRSGQGRLRHMELFALPPQRVLAVLVTTAGLVHNRFLEVGRDYGGAELEQAANYLNERFAGAALPQVRRALARDAGEAPRAAADLGAAALDPGEEAEELFLEGQGNLLDYPELAGGERLRALFHMLEHRDELIDLLEAPAPDVAAPGTGVRLRIGEELAHEALAECSVLAADYRTGDESVGRVAVIGPARMDYATAIPFVDGTAEQLGAMLSDDSAAPRPPETV